MRRGRTQAIYRYLPGSVVDYSDTHTIARVSGWNSREVVGINKERLVDEVMRRAAHFKVATGRNVLFKPEGIAVLEPISIEVELFPLTFICSNCGKAYYFRTIKEFNSAMRKSDYKCLSCRSVLNQMDIVHYHKCGGLEGPRPEACRTHKYDDIVLDKKGSSSIYKWKWVCRVCGKETGNVSFMCHDCRTPMDSSPFRKGAVFQPQSISLINVPKKRTGLREKKLLVASYLGLAEYSDIERLNSQADAADHDRKMNEMIEEMRNEGVPEKYIEKMRGKLKASKAKSQAEVFSELDPLMEGLQGEALDLAANCVHDFQETLHLENVRSISDIVNSAVSSDGPTAKIAPLFVEKMNRIGIANAWIIGDFPMMRSTYGYIRGNAEPNDCILKSFPIDKIAPGKIPIYSVSMETEAILLELDRRMVYEWLVNNKIVKEAIDADDEKQLKSWFFRNIRMDRIPVFDEIDDQDPLIKAVYSLTHTLSHALLRHAAGLIGIDEGSVGEIILPNIPAIILYSNQTADFQLGGMFTLMETSVIPWLDSSVFDMETCLYDPLCMETGAACHACLHISETACTHFNRNLGRNLLIGGNNWIGFWSHLYEG